MKKLIAILFVIITLVSVFATASANVMDYNAGWTYLGQTETNNQTFNKYMNDKFVVMIWDKIDETKTYFVGAKDKMSINGRLNSICEEMVKIVKRNSKTEFIEGYSFRIMDSSLGTKHNVAISESNGFIVTIDKNYIYMTICPISVNYN